MSARTDSIAPCSLAASDVQRAEGVSAPKPHQGTRIEVGAARELQNAGVGLGPPVRDQTLAVGFRKAACHAQPKPDRPAAVIQWLQRAVPVRGVHINGPDCDAMVAGIAHELRGIIESHRLRVENGTAEDVRVVAFHPGRGVGDEGKARGMAFREAIGAETFQLLEGALGKGLIVAIVDHAGDQLTAELVHAPGELEGRHRPAELVRFRRRETGGDHRHLHRLLLKQRHAEGFAEHLFELGFRKLNRLLALAAAQLGMHHVTLDWAEPDNGDFDHQI